MQGTHEDGRWVKSSCRCREPPRPEEMIPCRQTGRLAEGEPPSVTGVNVLSSECFKE